MNMKFIKTERCPTCNAPPCEEGVETDSFVFSTNNQPPKIREHVHGGTWEWRKFTCGYKVKYIPNFRQEQPSKYNHCLQDPVLVEAHDQRKVWLKEVVDYAKKSMDVDDCFRDYIVGKLTSTQPGDVPVSREEKS